MDKLTDFELNKAIAEALGLKFIEPFTGGYEGAITVKVPHTHVERYLDYCNNWNDLMPLVVEYLTAFWRAVDDPRAGDDAGKWTASWGSVLSPKVDWNDNPQRALAECLLKVLQEKQGDA